MADTRARPLPWLAVVALTAVAITALECFVLQRRYTSFTGGFLNPVYLQGGDLWLFLLGSVWLDAAAAALLALPALWLTRRVKRHALRLFLATTLCTLPLVGLVVARFDIAPFVDDVIEYRFGLAGLGTVLLCGICCAAALIGSLATYFVPDRFVGSWSVRRPLWWSLALLFGATLYFVVATDDVHMQMRRKTTGHWTDAMLVGATDFDGDGYGLIDRPTDMAPFDSARHPYAVDRPANGVDENGVGGDLKEPGDFAAEHYRPITYRTRPDIVLFVLESFRADNLEAEVDGRPVAPVLRGLLKDGAVSGPAYSHNGYTIQSLTHLFTGSLTGTVTTSVIDDFNENDYLTMCVSGEDESFGDIETVTGMRRADVFIDARNDVGERVTESAASSALVVPAAVVVRNLDAALKEHARDPRPVFAYVNLQDCHFPYTHYAMEGILEKNPVTRGEITQANVARVRRTYRNAAFHVDRAVGQVLDAWRRHRGRTPAFVIVGDHGESLFDAGVLGHGMDINPIQTRIPFLVGGLPVRCVFPLGQADVRRMLRDALTATSESPAGVVDPRKWVWQYVGSVRRPQLLGASGASGGVVFDVRRGTYRTWGDPPENLKPPFPAIVTLWEQVALHHAEARARDAD